MNGCVSMLLIREHILNLMTSSLLGRGPKIEGEFSSEVIELSEQWGMELVFSIAVEMVLDNEACAHYCK